tara:strand:+ start:894 stop:1037 length:144 start_codon:yes stop_codon:yes gene_type:complete
VVQVVVEVVDLLLLLGQVDPVMYQLFLLQMVGLKVMQVVMVQLVAVI